MKIYHQNFKLDELNKTKSSVKTYGYISILRKLQHFIMKTKYLSLTISTTCIKSKAVKTCKMNWSSRNKTADLKIYDIKLYDMEGKL